ncbi:MAG TPA: tripartite tricarboxylate transporter substrate binding protein [Xanthobacteraceae bacterium]|nr:tripartite tricarboxylate transporter substrate binding protein [Xanthobacteraceae bacterium]
MFVSRRQLAIGAISLAGAAAFNHVARANYPDKPIRIIVGFAAGGPADSLSRIIGQTLLQQLGKPIIVEAVTGAGGNLATERVAKSAPDGYTLLMASSGMIVVNPAIYRQLSFDPSTDLLPISLVGFTPNILVVHKDVPAQTVAELIALAVANPGALTFGSGGIGSSNHLCGELFNSLAHVKVQHVPYRGISQAVPDLLGGRLTMLFANAPTVQQLIREGKLRALAVTASKRWAGLPELPTLAEVGLVDYDVVTWFGLFAPAGTPRSVVELLHRETTRAIGLPEVRALLTSQAIEPIGSSPQELAAVVNSETRLWRKLLADTAVTPPN